MAVRKPKATPVTQLTPSTMVPKGQPRPKDCGALFAIIGDTGVVTSKGDLRTAAEGCKHLTMHRGDHSTAKPRGRMTRVERQAADRRKTSAKPVVVASKVVAVGGTKFRVFANGKVEALSSPSIEPMSADVVTPAPKARRPKVRTIRAVKADRIVAAPAKVIHTRRSVTSGQPSARLA